MTEQDKDLIPFEGTEDEELRRFRGQWKIPGRSLVGELLQERREEAHREQKELGGTDVH
jgi:hypothetical protein